MTKEAERPEAVKLLMLGEPSPTHREQPIRISYVRRSKTSGAEVGGAGNDEETTNICRELKTDALGLAFQRESGSYRQSRRRLFFSRQRLSAYIFKIIRTNGSKTSVKLVRWR